MGNCNCFQISNMQKMQGNNDFHIEEAVNQEVENLNLNKSEKAIKPYSNENTNTTGIHQKASPRGVNNPTQNNIKKNKYCGSKEAQKLGYEADKKPKATVEAKHNTRDKFEDTTDKEVNYDTITSLKNNQENSNNNRDVKGFSANRNNKNHGGGNNITCNNTNTQEDSMLKKDTINANKPALITKLTDAMKIKDLSKNLKPDKKSNINVILLGDKCVGKTSIVYQYISNKFDQYYIQTIIKEEFTKVSNVNGKKYNINFIVTAGVREYQEDYTDLYKVSDFFVVCFDMSNKASFEKAKEIITKEIIPYVFLYNERYANIILIGNKSDLKDKVVDQQKIKEYCKHYNIDFYETSAKMKTNVTKVFNKIVEIYDDAIERIGIDQ